MSTRALKLASQVYAPASRSPTAAGHVYISHGLLGNGKNWAGTAAKLAQSPALRGKLRAVISLDARNHGSSPHNGDHSDAALASDLEKVVLDGQRELQQLLEPPLTAADGLNRADRQRHVDSLTGKRSILIGHSMGGCCCMATLLRRYNESSLLPHSTVSNGGAFGDWADNRCAATRQSMRQLNEDFNFADTQPIRDVLFDDPSLSNDDRSATAAIATRVPAVGRIGAAIIVDVTPSVRIGAQHQGGDTVDATLNRMAKAQLGKIRSYEDANVELLRLGMLDKSMRDFVLTNLVLDPQRKAGATWRCNLDVLRAQYGAFRPSITDWFSAGAPADGSRQHSTCPRPCTLPVLFVFGSKSAYNEPTNRARIAQFFPNATQAVVEGAGHFVHYEKPQGFLDAVLPFMAEHM